MAEGSYVVQSKYLPSYYNEFPKIYRHYHLGYTLFVNYRQSNETVRRFLLCVVCEGLIKIKGNGVLCFFRPQRRPSRVKSFFAECFQKHPNEFFLNYDRRPGNGRTTIFLVSGWSLTPRESIIVNQN